jgi:hypothetical protein
MAACYSSDSESDASSDDVSIPPTVLSRKVKMTRMELGENFPVRDVERESRRLGLETLMIPRDFGDVRGNSFCLSDSEDDMKGYTPPPPQRKRKLSTRETFQEPAQIEEEGTHEFMSHKNQKEVTHEFMSHKNHDKGNRNFFAEQRPEFMTSMSVQSRKGSSSEVVSTGRDIIGETKGSRLVARKQKNSKISRVASPVSSDCKIVSLAETDSESWESSGEIRRSPRTVERFRQQLSEKQQRDFSERRYREKLTSTIVGRQKPSSGSDSDSYAQQPILLRGKLGVAPRTQLSEDRSAQLAPQKVKRVKDHQFTKVKLEKEDIVATKRKSCCRNFCLLVLGTRGIRQAREKYFRLKSQDRPSSLQWLVGRGETQNEDETTIGGCQSLQPASWLDYKIFQSAVCRKAFKLVFCIGNHMLSRLRVLKNHSVETQKPVGRVRSSLSYILESWLEDFFNNNCEKLPNKDIVHLPDSFSKLEVWKIFKSSFSNFDKYENVSYRFFCKAWRKHFPNVKIPKMNRFGVCADCEEFKTIREKAVTAEDKSKSSLEIRFFTICF